MPRPRLLDLFCCAGGAAMGYYRAGFDVVGVDIKPQKRYPFEFIQADCLALGMDFIRGFDAVHASPPCQIHSITAKMTGAHGHIDLIPQTRAMLTDSGLPYIIENVPGAPMYDPVILCGLMFGLRVYRHRLFESNCFLLAPSHPAHRGYTNASRSYSSFKDGASIICCAGHNFRREDGALAMKIDWPMTRKEMAQAIPPAYTEFLGRQLLSFIDQKEAA